MNGETSADDLTFYDKDVREELIEDGELTAEEAAFMQGYEDAEDIDKE